MDSFANNEANQMFESIYKNALMSTVGTAFITSFCIHKRREVQKDGLLSIWKYYGKEGFAIEFNDKLSYLIKEICMKKPLPKKVVYPLVLHKKECCEYIPASVEYIGNLEEGGFD
jgi:hypothetical protein